MEGVLGAVVELVGAELDFSSVPDYSPKRPLRTRKTRALLRLLAERYPGSVYDARDVQAALPYFSWDKVDLRVAVWQARRHFRDAGVLVDVINTDANGYRIAPAQSPTARTRRRPDST